MSLLIETAVCLSVDTDYDQRPALRRMSAPSLSTEAQLRYLLQWFAEFSELQREDFLPVLAAARSGHREQLAAALATLSCDDKPVSLFQCRIKLFNEWYPTWSEDETSRLLAGVTNIDAEFAKKLNELVSNGFEANGELNGVHSPNDLAEQAKDEVSENEIQKDENEETVQDIVNDNMPIEIAATS